MAIVRRCAHYIICADAESIPEQATRSEVVSRSSKNLVAAAAETPPAKNPENSIVSAPERFHPWDGPDIGSGHVADPDSGCSPGKKDDTANPETEVSARFSRMTEDLDQALHESLSVLRQLQQSQDSRNQLFASLEKLDAFLLQRRLEQQQQHFQRQSQPQPSHSQTKNKSAKVSRSQSRSETQQASGSSGSLGVVRQSVVGESEEATWVHYQELLKKCRQDIGHVQAQDGPLNSSLRSLRDKEIRLKDAQATLVADLKHPPTAYMLAREIRKWSKAASGAAKRSRTHSDVPSLVQKYFDKKAEVGVWLERQEELQDAREEGRVEREFIADRGDPLEVSDEDFNANYDVRLAYIASELKVAQGEAEDLLQKCTASDYEPWRWQTRPDSSLSTASSETPLPDVDPEPIVRPAKSRQAIDSWLRTVPESDADTTELTGAIGSMPGTEDDPTSASSEKRLGNTARHEGPLA